MNDGLAQHIIVSDTVHYDKRTNVGTVECILSLDVFGIKDHFEFELSSFTVHERYTVILARIVLNLLNIHV